MDENVYRLWERIGQHVALLPEIQVAENLRETSERGYSTPGREAFRIIRKIIDDEIQDCDGRTAYLFFKQGPNSDPRLAHVYRGLANMNEYTNALGYLHAKAIERLAQLGDGGKTTLAILADMNNGFKGRFYHAEGGRYGPAILLEDVIQEAL